MSRCICDKHVHTEDCPAYLGDKCESTAYVNPKQSAIT